MVDPNLYLSLEEARRRRNLALAQALSAPVGEATRGMLDAAQQMQQRQIQLNRIKNQDEREAAAQARFEALERERATDNALAAAREARQAAMEEERQRWKQYDERKPGIAAMPKVAPTGINAIEETAITEPGGKSGYVRQTTRIGTFDPRKAEIGKLGFSEDEAGPMAASMDADLLADARKQEAAREREDRIFGRQVWREEKRAERTGPRMSDWEKRGIGATEKDIASLERRIAAARRTYGDTFATEDARKAAAKTIEALEPEVGRLRQERDTLIAGGAGKPQVTAAEIKAEGKRLKAENPALTIDEAVAQAKRNLGVE